MSDYVEIECRNNWGSYYYARKGEGLTAWGTCDTSRAIEFKAGQKLSVEWPDGSRSRVTLAERKVVETVGDHGHYNSVGSSLYGVRKRVQGVETWVPLERLRVKL